MRHYYIQDKDFIKEHFEPIYVEDYDVQLLGLDIKAKENFAAWLNANTPGWNFERVPMMPGCTPGRHVGNIRMKFRTDNHIALFKLTWC